MNGEKEEREGTSVRAEETDTPPREREAREAAANGVPRAPGPTISQPPVAEDTEGTGTIVKPANADDVDATASTSSSSLSEKRGRAARSPRAIVERQREEVRIPKQRSKKKRRKEGMDA